VLSGIQRIALCELLAIRLVCYLDLKVQPATSHWVWVRVWV